MTLVATGWQIKHTLKKIRTRIDLLESEFGSSTTHFEGDPRPDLVALDNEIDKLEQKYVQVQHLQTLYNLQSKTANGCLLDAVRRAGSTGRRRKRWEALVKGTKTTSRSLFGDSSTQRKADTVYALSSVSKEEAKARYVEVEAIACNTGESIENANSFSITFPDLPSTYLDI